MSDTDSLFGSPPPSPQRGRSPSLALPEGGEWRSSSALENTQNVGNIALPGSPNRSELPVSQPALPSAKKQVLSLRPPASRLQVRSKATRHPPKPRFVQSRQTTRVLHDLAGLLSNFTPNATLSSTRPTPISIRSAQPKPITNVETRQLGTQDNPIEINDTPDPADAVNNALVALASIAANALKLPAKPVDGPSIPTINTIFHYVKQDPKLIPTLTAAYEYIGIVSQPQNVPSNSPMTGRHSPAYLVQWQLQQGRWVLGELIGLFERGISKCKPSHFQPSSEPPRKRLRTQPPESVVEANPTQASLPSVEEFGLDSQRMAEWLSSVTNSSNASIVDSINVNEVPPTPPDIPSLTSDNELDFMSLFGSDPLFKDALNATDLDFSRSFESFDFQSCMDWESLLPSDPLPEPFQNNANTTSPITPALNLDLDSFTTQLQQPLAAVDNAAGTSASDTTVTHMNPGEMESANPSWLQLNIPGNECNMDLDPTDSVSVSDQSQYTIPTTSGASYYEETPVTPTSRLISPAPGTASFSSGSVSTKLQRKAVVLDKAQRHREVLLRELERIRMARWELLIEGGVVRNLEKITAAS